MNRQHRGRAIALKILCGTLLIPCIACASPFAYVPNEKSGTISIIDSATDAVVAEVRVGAKPRGLAIAGKTLFVSDQPANALVMMDLESRHVSGTVPLGESPEGVSASAAGDWVAAASEISNAVNFIATATKRKEFSVVTEGKNPEHAVFSPDGRMLLVSAEEADSVDLVDVAGRRQVASIKVGMRPRGIAFRPDGLVAYVACELASTVYVIDVPGRRVMKEIKAGEFSNGVAMAPDGRRVYVSNGKDGTVSVIDTESNAVVATVAVGKRPWNMAITPDGKKLYVANGRSNSVSVIDTASNTVRKEISVGEMPWGVVIK